MINLSNLTILIAHPDDEVIFGWLVLKRAKKIISIVSDENNPTLPSYKNRKFALQKIGKLIGAEVINLGFNSNFYQKSSEILIPSILKSIEKESLIFTHNEFGDYGHPDHILIHDIAIQSQIPIIVSDVAFKPKEAKVTGNFIETCYNDLEFYNRCRDIYLKYNCWTWDYPDTRKWGIPIKANLMEKTK